MSDLGFKDILNDLPGPLLDLDLENGPVVFRVKHYSAGKHSSGLFFPVLIRFGFHGFSLYEGNPE